MLVLIGPCRCALDKSIHVLSEVLNRLNSKIDKRKTERRVREATPHGCTFLRVNWKKGTAHIAAPHGRRVLLNSVRSHFNVKFNFELLNYGDSLPDALLRGGVDDIADQRPAAFAGGS